MSFKTRSWYAAGWGADQVGRRLARRRAARRAFFSLARYFTPTLVDPMSGMRVHTADRVIGRHIFVRRQPWDDARVLDEALAHLAKRVPSGGLLVDVGANIGTTCIYALTSGSAERAIAFEPEPRNFALLNSNIISHGLTDQITAKQFAVSDHEGTGELSLASTNFGDHQLLRAAGRETVRVPVTTLDAMVKSGEVDRNEVRLVWIDAQGHDGHVLAGASSLHAVPTVVEFWPRGLQESNGYGMFREIAGREFAEIVDMATVPPTVVTASPEAVDSLAERYAESDNIDLLLVPRVA